jgi:hypothetical protein
MSLFPLHTSSGAYLVKDFTVFWQLWFIPLIPCSVWQNLFQIFFIIFSSFGDITRSCNIALTGNNDSLYNLFPGTHLFVNSWNCLHQNLLADTSLHHLWNIRITTPSDKPVRHWRERQAAGGTEPTRTGSDLVGWDPRAGSKPDVDAGRLHCGWIDHQFMLLSLYTYCPLSFAARGPHWHSTKTIQGSKQHTQIHKVAIVTVRNDFRLATPPEYDILYPVFITNVETLHTTHKTPVSLQS